MHTTPVVGLDLGQASDFTALTIVEPAGDTLNVSHMERMRGIGYPRIVTRAVDVMAAPGLERATLVIDQTGCGRPVFDMFVAAGLRPVGITITGGDTVNGSGNEFRTPKRDLIAALQVALQNDQLKVAPDMELAQTFVAEALNFRVSISLAGHDSYAAGPSAQWREGAHDDLLLSVSMAVWFINRPRSPWGAV